MLARPRQIWSAYLLILALLVAGFIGLTVRVVELDHRERLSRAQADQEERIRLALWRMESVTMPIIAAEAARPYFVYEPFVSPSRRDKTSRVASPLLKQPSEYVLLNFQMDPQGRMVSPQCPVEEDREWAIRQGLTRANMDQNCPRLAELQAHLPRQALLASLPVESAPGATWTTSNLPYDVLSQQSPAEYVQNSNTLVMPGGEPVQEPAQKEYVSRAGRLQMLTQQSAIQQRQVVEAALPWVPVREGISRPLWMGDRLLLARRVEVGSETLVQGCWLDWERLRGELEHELDDLLPEATLETVPVSAVAAPGRMLASLPVQLVVPEATIDRNGWTPIQIALGVAWGALLLAGLALAGLLHGVTSLSERRAAFVSAVTHELRTPLTTLQLYTDMLTSDMVREESQRKEYLQTLHQEADRLSHLVENVLALSRLERQSARVACERVKLGALLDRAAPRLKARAEQSARPLEVTIDRYAKQALVAVEPTVVEQILLNLVDNSCKHAVPAKDPRLQLAATFREGSVELRIQDSGPGLSDAACGKLFRRFSKSDVEAARTTPGLGLGLALSRELARAEGGDLQLEQTGPEGTIFLLRLPTARLTG